MLAIVAAVLLMPAPAWVTTWAATPAPRWGKDIPPPFAVPETLTDQTVRQIVRTSVGGQQIRIVISNEFGARPLTIGAATIALASNSSDIEPATLRSVTFGGKPSVVIPPGAPFVSDAVDLAAQPLSRLAVSLYFPQATAINSVHWDGIQTGYISARGNETKDIHFAAAATTGSRFFLSGLMVNATPSSTGVVIFGDSISDGACSTRDANKRWPDHLAERFQAEGHPHVAVVNEAFSGNRVLTNGMGTNALARFDMSILRHPHVSTLIMTMGLNDIGWPGRNSLTPAEPVPTADDIINGYGQVIERAHEHGIRVIMGTLTPFADALVGTPLSGYYTPEKDAIRRRVNAWIRTNKTADGLIDFDKVLEDPQNPGHLRRGFACSDHLHPNDAGYQAMANSVNLDLMVSAK
ncbi:MAG TPA: SGNH/GDSL hydrolase family protein [Steroidobacteraceae bacterium]